MTERTILLNGLVADGSGGELFPGDILIQDGQIRDVGRFDNPAEAELLDCAGLVVAPGFIDAHSHSDLQVIGNKREKLLQGVTSEVVGNCGFSAYPCSSGQELREFANGILCGDDSWGWRSAASYLLEVQAKAKFASVASLVGHGSLRIAHAGPRQGATDEATLCAMEGTLDEALVEGAAGFSTGLMYAPGSSAPAVELERLCRVVAQRDKIYCTHMRDYSTHLIDALDEQIQLARKTGCRLQISHLQAVGRENWRLNSLALERIELARNQGVDIMFDCYPYVAGSTVLTQLLPQWTLDGGADALVARLQEPSTRREIAKQTLDGMVHEWGDIFISGTGSTRSAEVAGKSIVELSKERSELPMDVVLNLLVEEGGKVNMLQFNQSEDNLKANLAHPLSIIISDGFYVQGKPHPRLHGTFPELLGNICRDRKWLPLPEAIRKVTGSPATRFKMDGRGYLKQGYVADVAIFDPARLKSRATYTTPELAPEGLTGVIRGGKVLLWQPLSN
jgi:N-acyl-D-amino-acid deacylase